MDNPWYPRNPAMLMEWTSQRYVDGAGTETRSAAELNPLYDLLNTRERHS
jgi:hypothetical protein